ncbi:MAG: DMT family transporter [Hyphomicrobiales bacterium]|uniref:DMT family transporter n=1 Tax=Rhabdaerophilum calidifontis TaxID=2604328 RepID=UPI001238DAE2|nr:DMT family transporter [Rhabdaerophilum calidifontis]MCA1952182.1 DMT family transporter [Hyphomicrobiales bacterium]
MSSPDSPPASEIEHALPAQRPLIGILFKLASAFAFSCMGAIVKILGASPASHTGFPVGQVVFCRSFFALIPVFVWLALVGRLNTAFATTNRAGHLKRGLIGSLGMFFGFAGLTTLPLPDATAISFAAPLFSVVLAALLLGEVVRLYRWTAVLVGFCGVIVMLWPHLSADALSISGSDIRARGAFFSLAGAICAAFAMIEVRRLTNTETTAAIVTYFSLMTTTFGMISVLAGAFDPKWAWVAPSAREMLLLVLTGIMGGFGQIFLTESYRRAPASLVAPFDYTGMIFAIAWGYFLFSDIPDDLILIGAAIVSAAGIFVILRERQLGIDRARQSEASSQRAV